MLKRPTTDRLTAASFALVLAAGPLAVALKAADSPAAAANPAIITGHVKDENGNVLADARVVAAIPATDMRFVFPGTGQRIVETTADKQGVYRLQLPELKEPIRVSLNATKPGYRSLVGTLMSGGDTLEFDIAPAVTVTQHVKLKPALYFKATVVDESLKPIAGVQVNANLKFMRSTGGIQLSATRADGTFEIFNFPFGPANQHENAEGVIYLHHPHYIATQIDDIYSLTPAQRANLNVVMDAGRQVSGRVLSSEGQPVAGVMIEAIGAGHRKAALTDANGSFRLRGLVGGEIEFRVRAIKIGQKSKEKVAVDRDLENVEFRLQPLSLAQPETVKVLGLTLADVTPELQVAYDLPLPQGVLILDPGKDFARLEIGELAEGYSFFMAGTRQIAGVRGFLEQILTDVQKDDAGRGQCRIVYTYFNLDGTGTNTQYLTLTPDDLLEIENVIRELKK